MLLRGAVLGSEARHFLLAVRHRPPATHRPVLAGGEVRAGGPMLVRAHQWARRHSPVTICVLALIRNACFAHVGWRQLAEGRGRAGRACTCAVPTKVWCDERLLVVMDIVDIFE